MYGSSYSSYSSSSSSTRSFFSPYSSPTTAVTTTIAIDIAPSPFSTQAPEASCAFPSWPRRSSLGGWDAPEDRPSCYFSDEELLEIDSFSEDDLSSHGGSPNQSPIPQQPQIDYEAAKRQVLRILALEQREQRRRAAMMGKKRRTSPSSKKSKGRTVSMMTPIAEAD
ncbi:uncharacterized protein CTHT_0005560 [Thermochaetoides thermophila DSM 1495]|uniref:Uncharacterized protein n=1 Tax=Chaetomium thermophilum (strain DSM 1495 / CBS 144.50 / IMI 039719) TaxID=759272 RepID=G0RY62_CHATD|nr:hypothetical protein CTHT_0005560 [Thermochaetoides thermophila DSM 1495]EGS23848.1 hypothetical protein CTHT_0005560 [Thermochaetoides thermophila DSM 1495]